VIAIDTNILLRFVVNDEPRQAERVARLFEDELSAQSPGFVSLIVVCEFVWALKRTFAIERDVIAATLVELLRMSRLVVEHGEIVEAATRGSGDIADLIIHSVGTRSGCTHTLTFDKKFARLDGVELLA
jgi:predicted nucleic-acid-binding protein